MCNRHKRGSWQATCLRRKSILRCEYPLSVLIFFFFFGFHMPFMLPRVIISTAGSNVATVESLGFCVICALAVTAITSASPNRYERLNEATSTDSLALEMLVFSSLRGYWQDLRNISIELLCFFSWISIAALVVENVHATSAKPV